MVRNDQIEMRNKSPLNEFEYFFFIFLNFSTIFLITVALCLMAIDSHVDSITSIVVTCSLKSYHLVSSSFFLEFLRYFKCYILCVAFKFFWRKKRIAKLVNHHLVCKAWFSQRERFLDWIMSELFEEEKRLIEL